MEERDRQSHAPSRHPCEGMSLQEVLRFVAFLMDSLQEKNVALKSITEKLDSIMAQLEDARMENRQNAENMRALTKLVESLTAERDRLRLEIEKKTGENAVNRKFRFGGPSQRAAMMTGMTLTAHWTPTRVLGPSQRQAPQSRKLRISPRLGRHARSVRA